MGCRDIARHNGMVTHPVTLRGIIAMGSRLWIVVFAWLSLGGRLWKSGFAIRL